MTGEDVSPPQRAGVLAKGLKDRGESIDPGRKGREWGFGSPIGLPQKRPLEGEVPGFSKG